jgi:hypothetical protein
VGEKARICAFFFLARCFRFFLPLFFFALFWLGARERESAKKAPAPTSVTSNGLVTFIAAVTSKRNRIVTLKTGKALKVASLFYQ